MQPPLRLAVLTQDPTFGGGGRAQTEAFVAAARALGHPSTLVWAPHPALAGRRWTVERVEALRQVRAARSLVPRLAKAQATWVVATTAPAGAAALNASSTYACWIGTTVDDEWRGRRAGLGMARRAAFAPSLPVLRRLERRVLHNAERLYATSPASRAALTATGAAPVTGIGILPIPVDVEAFAPVPDDVWIAGLERPVLAFVGRAWDPRKNVRLLLDALPLLRRRIPEATVRLIGEPPGRRLPDGVEATGPVASVAAHLRTAALLVLPSFQEGFGIVAAEALAAGVPVLATRSGGPEWLVEASEAGRLLDTFEAEELATAAADLLEDVATLIAMRRRGREYVEREHAPTTFLARLAEALVASEGR